MMIAAAERGGVCKANPSTGKAKKPSSQSTPHDPQNCTEIAHRILGFTVARALDNSYSLCHNRNVKYVTEDEMRSNGTQTEHTRPTDTRASPRRCPPALSSAGLSGDEHRCHSGGGGHFLEGDPLPPLCQQGGPLRRCPEPPDAGAAGLFRETCGLAHTS